MVKIHLSRLARRVAIVLAAAGLVAVAAAAPAQADESGATVPAADSSSETGRIGSNHNQVLA